MLIFDIIIYSLKCRIIKIIIAMSIHNAFQLSLGKKEMQY